MMEEVIMLRVQTKKDLWRLAFVFAIGLILSVGSTANAIPKGGYAHPEILIQPEELKEFTDRRDPNIRIIDVRERGKYLAGHVPGAVHVWRPELVDKNHPIPGMMASREQVESLLGGLGISDKHTLIIYSDGPDNGRLWWILAFYGVPFHQLRILDGGLDGWKAKGYATETESPKFEKTVFHLPKEAKGRKPLLCTLPEVKSALKQADRVVLDVRSKKEVIGEEVKEGAVKGGRIPGVTWIEWNEVLIAEGPFKGYWKSAEEIKKIFSAKGVTPEKEIFMY
jgi:thiosulfate/3-mercaptopyruvate sulfurtransferase